MGGKSKSSTNNEQKDNKVVGEEGAIVVGAENSGAVNVTDGGAFSLANALGLKNLDVSENIANQSFQFAESAGRQSIGLIEDLTSQAFNTIAGNTAATVSAIQESNTNDSTLIGRDITKIAIPAALFATTAFVIFRGK